MFLSKPTQTTCFFGSQIDARLNDVVTREAHEEFNQVTLQNYLLGEIQELIYMFVRKECARERRELNPKVKHQVHLYNSWNETMYHGPIKSQTSKSLLYNKICTHFYDHYQTMTGRTKKCYFGRTLAKADQYLERAKDFFNRFPLGIDFFLPQTNCHSILLYIQWELVLRNHKYKTVGCMQIQSL